MLKSLGEILAKTLNYLLPKRSDFDIVERLSEEEILNLPRSEKIQDLDWVFPIFKYKNPKVKAIIWELKYKDNTKPLDIIGKLIFDEIISVILDISLFDQEAKFILIPIPITKNKKIERGYNQSERIAKSVLENDLGHLLLYAPQWFEKTKDTPPQSHSVSREERIINLKSCFEASPQIADKYIILIDDVVTTGSTLVEARETLKKSGAKEVYAFTIAH